MKKLIFGAAAAVAVATLVAGCRSGSACCDKKGCAKMTNQEFYEGGTFDANGINKGGKFNAAKATEAYFEMFRHNRDKN